MLSITGKVAALFAQSVNDEVVIDGVNDIEALGSNLSRKIWQKITLIENHPAAQPLATPGPANKTPSPRRAPKLSGGRRGVPLSGARAAGSARGDQALQRRRVPGFSARRSSALEFVDLGLPAAMEVLQSTGAPRGRRRTCAGRRAEREIRQAEHVWQEGWAQPPIPAGQWRRRSLPPAPRRSCGADKPPAAVGKLLASGRPDNALSALLRLSRSLPHWTACMSGWEATARPTTSRSRQGRHTRLDNYLAIGGAGEGREASFVSIGRR